MLFKIMEVYEREFERLDELGSIVDRIAKTINADYRGGEREKLKLLLEQGKEYRLITNGFKGFEYERWVEIGSLDNGKYLFKTNDRNVMKILLEHKVRGIVERFEH